MQAEVVGISVIPVMIIISEQPRDNPKLRAIQTSQRELYISFIKGE